MRSEATTVASYLAELPEDRRKALKAVRATIRAHLPAGMVETMRWGMISYEVPLKASGPTYNGQPLLYAALASQKNHMAIYLTAVYADETLAARFEEEWRATGNRLDMGKSCVRFRRLEQVPLDVVADAIAATDLPGFLAMVGKAQR